MTWTQEKEAEFQRLKNQYGDISTEQNISEQPISQGEAFWGSAKTGAKGNWYGIEQLIRQEEKNSFYNPLGGLFINEEKYNKEMQELEKKALTNREKQEQYFAEHPWTSIAGRIVGEGPLLAIGGGLGAAAKGIGYLGKILHGAKSGAKAGSLGGGAIGGLQYTTDEESRLNNALLSALYGGVGGGILGGSFSAANPKNIIGAFKGGASSEKLASNAAAAQGTETGLGRVVESPALAGIHENVLKYFPFSGYEGAQNRTRQVIEDRGEKALGAVSEKKGTSETDMRELLQEELQTYGKKTRETSSGKYKVISDMATKLGIKPSTSNLEATSKQIFNEIDRSPLLSTEQSTSLKSDIKSYLDAINIGNEIEYTPEGILKRLELIKSGKSVNPETIESLGLFKGKLGDKSFSSLMKNERYESGKYAKLKGAVDKDIRESVEKTGNNELIDLMKDVNDFYKKNVVPLEDPRIKQFIDDTTLTNSEKIISTFVKTGPRKDAIKTLEKLTDKLSPEGIDRLRYALFSTPEGDASAKGMIDVFNKLGQKQKDKLLPPVSRERALFEDLGKLVEMNPDVFNQMFSPKTGYGNRMLESIQAFGPKIAGGGLALLGMADPMTAIMAAGMLASGRGANKLLTSEKFRNYIVNSSQKEGKSTNEEMIGRELKKLSMAINKSMSAEAGTKEERK